MRMNFLNKMSRNSQYRRSNIIINGSMLIIFLGLVIVKPLQVFTMFLILLGILWFANRK